MNITLAQLNAAPLDEAAHMLDGLYEHSPWIARQALASRPFLSLAHLKYTMAMVLHQAGTSAQIALICAHPELAGKAMVDNTLTPESSTEQNKAGLTHCTPDEYAQILQLNADYQAKFGWPFILAVRGPRGVGLHKKQIIETFARRLLGHRDFELQECLRNIHRIVEIRLQDKFAEQPTLGDELWDWHESLAQFSDAGYLEKGQLTVTYMTPAHRACAAHIAQQMRSCGFDSVEIDVLGNVVGRYLPASMALASAESPYLLTGSHYDTVRNGGKYDGRLGIFTPMACVRELVRTNRRLPFGIEVVGFAEEEGQRYKATFLAASALVGSFDEKWLTQKDSEGISLDVSVAPSKLAIENISKLRRNPAHYLGFVELHIEQGPVLNALHLPLGVVTSINGSVRMQCEITGQASHAGTTPMATRRDAAAAFAEFALFVEQRAARDGDSVATVGMLSVPSGSVNVVPGRCQFSLDMRAPTDAQRDAMVADILDALKNICDQRSVAFSTEETMRAAAAPSNAAWQARWEQSVAKLGLPVFKMPSGAGHDAMKMHEIMPQAMLFVRGENAGISHNPLESTSSSDMQLCVDAFQNLLSNLAAEKNTL